MAFIYGSVGDAAKRSRNRKRDVQLVQQLLNHAILTNIDLSPHYAVTGSLGPGAKALAKKAPAQTAGAKRDPFRSPFIETTGRMDKLTLEAIQRFQATFMQSPDGKISPKRTTIQRLWPVKYANPTGLTIRISDKWGAGHHGAPRGSRRHDGTDYKCTAGQSVKSPISGRVVRVSRPYNVAKEKDEKKKKEKGKLSGLLIAASDGSIAKVWYIKPDAEIVGKVVAAGQTIGTALTLKNLYPGITDHVHVQIRGPKNQKVNPQHVIK